MKCPKCGFVWSLPYHAAGGRASAARLSALERSLRARRAAVARWAVRGAIKAKSGGVL